MHLPLLLLMTQEPQWSQCLQVTGRALSHLRQRRVRPLCTRRPLPTQLILDSPWLALQTLQTLLSLWNKLPQSHLRQLSQRQVAAFLQVGYMAAHH